MRIVNPILIYFAGIVGNLKGWLIVLSILALLVACASFVYYMFEFEECGYDCYVSKRDESDKQKRKAWNWLRNSGHLQAKTALLT